MQIITTEQERNGVVYNAKGDLVALPAYSLAINNLGGSVPRSITFNGSAAGASGTITNSDGDTPISWVDNLLVDGDEPAGFYDDFEITWTDSDYGGNSVVASNVTPIYRTGGQFASIGTYQSLPATFTVNAFQGDTVEWNVTIRKISTGATVSTIVQINV